METSFIKIILLIHFAKCISLEILSHMDVYYAIIILYIKVVFKTKIKHIKTIKNKNDVILRFDF